MRFSLVLLALGLLSMAGAQRNGETGQAQTAPTPARIVLEQMSQAERANSCISVEFEGSDSDAIMLGRQVERLWNGGQYDEALSQLDSLEGRVGRVAIGNSWRKPVPTLETDLWGRDVRIGNRDSLQDVAFDVQDSSGNLFAVLRHNATAPHFSVCLSTDGGATWDETFTWSGSPPMAIDAAVYTNHLYVVYNSPLDDPQHLRVRRFLCSNGQPDTFSGGGAWVVPCTLEVGDTMKEVSLAPNQSEDLLNLVSLLSGGNVLWSASSGAVGYASWGSTEIVSGASNGLNATGDLNYDTTIFFVSYYDANDTLRIYRENWGGLKPVLSLLTGRGTPTSMSAYGDTIICLFEDETSSPYQVRYVITSIDSDTWRLGTLSSPDTAAEAPAVVTSSAGTAAVYRDLAPTRELRFRSRTFYGPWSDPVSIADHEPYWNRPGIQYLSTSGAFGVIYLSNTGPAVRGAYFDRSDWVSGIAEQRRLITDENILSVFPNPLSGRGRLTYTLNHQADLRLQVYDRTGRIVRTLFDGRSAGGRQSLGFDAAGMTPGVYFIRAEADGRALTVPVTVVK